MSVRSMHAKLEALQRKHDAELAELGDEIRTRVVKPLCDRYQLDFVQGMGTYFFSKGRTTYGSPEDATGQLRRALEPVFALLDAEAPDRHPIGFQVVDYRYAGMRPTP